MEDKLSPDGIPNIFDDTYHQEVDAQITKKMHEQMKDAVRAKIEKEMGVPAAGGPGNTQTPEEFVKQHCPFGFAPSNINSDRCINCGRSYTWHAVRTGDPWASAPAAPVPLTVPPHNHPRDLTHILHQGSPLCRFTTQRYTDWPEGHYWVSMQARVEGASVNCDVCTAEFVQLTGRKPK